MALRNAGRVLGHVARVGGAVAAPVEAAAVVGAPSSLWGARALHASATPLTKCVLPWDQAVESAPHTAAAPLNLAPPYELWRRLLSTLQ